MKLIDVAEFYSEHGGGVRTYIHQKLACASALGHEVVIVAPGPRSFENTLQGGRIVWIPSPPERFDPRYHRFADPAAVHAVLERERPDVVEASSPWRAARIVADWHGPAVKSFFIHQDPVAVYPHTFLDRFLSRPAIDRLFGWFWAYLRRLSRQYDTCIVSGQWLADRLASFGLKRLEAIPFGIDKSAFSPGLRDLDHRRDMLRACRIDDPEATLLLTISRHHPEKRLRTAIAAVERLNRRRPVGLYVIGDGPFRSRVERWARSAPQVHLAGYIADGAGIASALASADALLHASAAETYGLVVAEALCSGLPLVVPQVGGAAELADPRYAETYPPGDAVACAAAIEWLLARDRAALSAAAAQAGIAAVRAPIDHFRDLFRHYEDLVSRRRAAGAA